MTSIQYVPSDDFLYYQVEEGDTLANIVKEKGMNLRTIALLNGLDVSDYVYPNQVLIIPSDAINLYITEKGDTLSSLEEKTGFTIDEIIRDNPDVYLLENQLIIERKND